MDIRISRLITLTLICAVLGACAASGNHRSTGEVIDDSTVATRIKTALLADKATDGLNIDVEVNRNRVQLNGFVDSQAQVNRAGEIARSTPGADSVRNNLKVSKGNRMAGEYVDDKLLVARVKSALASDSISRSLKIDVEVNRGEVSLGGYVNSEEERAAIIATAKNVNGVRNVINNISVR